MSAPSSRVFRDLALVILGGASGVLCLFLLAPWETSSQAEPDDEVDISATRSGSQSSRPSEQIRMKAPNHSVEIARLTQRLTALEKARRGGRETKSQGRFAETQADASSGKGSGAPQGATPAVEPAVEYLVDQLQEDNSPVRTAVQGMIDDAWQNRRQEWRAIRSASGEARDKDRVDRFAQKIELTDGQREAIASVISQERIKIRTIRREARENLDFEGIREKVEAVKGETDEGVSEFLSSDQIEAWQTFRKDEWRGRFR